MILEEIGNNIKQMRETHGISQVILSEKTGIGREQLSRIENGQVNMTVSTVHKISKAFNVSICDFFQFNSDYTEDAKTMKLKIKPFVKWAGGKTQVLSKIHELLPKTYNDYYEPFIGGGALLFDIQPKRAFINDVNCELVSAYNCFQDEVKYNKLVELIISHENNHSEEYYYEVRQQDREPGFESLSNISKAARMIYLNKACFNGLYRVNSKGYFNVPSGKKEKVKAYDVQVFEGIKTYFLNNKIEVTSKDFERAVKRAKKDDFVYFDPPYDTFDEQKNFTAYAKDAFGKDEQLRLSEVFKDLNKKGVKVMLSNHNTTLINELYSEFNITVIAAKRMINSNAKGRGNVEEVIITNYV